MKLPSSIWLALLPLLPFVHATCNVTGINAATLSGLADLRTPTPYTFTLSALASGCATDPQTLTDWVTWDVDGTNFPAATAATITFSAASFVYATFTFPDMTVTSLTPGERLTLLDGSGAANVYFVPQTAIPYTPTASTTSPTTSTQSPSTSQTQSSGGSSTPIGGIVAGSVVGGIAAIAILGFLIYKLRTHKRNTPPPAPIDFNSYGQPPTPMLEHPLHSPTGEFDPKHQSINAGYDPIAHDVEPMSGNLRNEY